MRPIKEGLDYFPVNVDMDQDDKIQLVEAKHGIIAFAIIIRLLMKIYKEGYYYPWSEKEQLLFSRRVNVDINDVNDIINDCLKWGLFDQEIYDRYQILTSKGIQKRYLAAVGRRQAVTLIREYLLVTPEEHYKKTINYINVGINRINDNNNPLSQYIDADIGTQRKEKKRKEKNSKEPAAVTVVNKSVIDAFNNNIHPITQMEMEYIADWLREMPEEVIIEAIKEAVANNVRKWSYINGILNNWKAQGWTSLESIQAARRDRADQAAQKRQKEQEQPVGITGEEAWLEVQKRAKRPYEPNWEWSHPAIKDALLSIGGLRNVMDCDPSSVPYLKAQFVKAFEVLVRRTETERM